MTLLQMSIRNISTDTSFKDRWTRISSLETGLKVRYKYDSSVTISKQQISRAIGRMDQAIDIQSVKHVSGIYRYRFNNEMFYFFQNPSLKPPLFPNPDDKELWSKIIQQDEKALQSFISRTELKDRLRSQAKRQKTDIVDLHNYVTRNKTAIDTIANNTILPIESQNSSVYWESPEAKILFVPKSDESTSDCLIRRIDLLGRASFDDSVLLLITDDVDDLDEISSHQKQVLRTQCLYLRQAYELAIQFMNDKTLMECIQNAIYVHQ